MQAQPRPLIACSFYGDGFKPSQAIEPVVPALLTASLTGLQCAKGGRVARITSFLPWAPQHLPFPMPGLEGTWRTCGSMLYFLWKLRPGAARGLTQSNKRTRGPAWTVSWVSEAGPQGWLRQGRERRASQWRARARIEAER